jgi:rhodanese-related sulfurtransferase
MAEFKRVSPAEAKKLLDAGYTYVDVRTVEEFDARHPEGAINVPLNLEGPPSEVPEFVRVMRLLFPPEAKVVVGCATGMRSMRAAQWLLQAGFTDVVDQRAGMEGARNAFGGVTEKGWAGQGLPTSQGPDAGSFAEVAKSRLK